MAPKQEVIVYRQYEDWPYWLVPVTDATRHWASHLARLDGMDYEDLTDDDFWAIDFVHENGTMIEGEFDFEDPRYDVVAKCQLDPDTYVEDVEDRQPIDWEAMPVDWDAAMDGADDERWERQLEEGARNLLAMYPPPPPEPQPRQRK